MEITREQFLSQRDPRFGRANPDRMNMPFWELMVRVKESAAWARYEFDAPALTEHEPIWCFDRFGMSVNKLADRRTIHIGGEHEDWYDEDFYIYNDVVVLEPDDKITIYGYPKEVFPPTDFHSATLIGDRILVIGCLGYQDERQSGVTPVYWLDCMTYRIEAFETSGENPGWIWEHEAELGQDCKTVIVRGGELFQETEGEERYSNNRGVYSLDIIEGLWRKVG